MARIRYNPFRFTPYTFDYFDGDDDTDLTRPDADWSLVTLASARNLVSERMIDTAMLHPGTWCIVPVYDAHEMP